MYSINQIIFISFNHIDLPPYSSYAMLKQKMMKVITEGITGFPIIIMKYNNSDNTTIFNYKNKFNNNNNITTTTTIIIIISITITIVIMIIIIINN